MEGVDIGANKRLSYITFSEVGVFLIIDPSGVLAARIICSASE